jgi:RimJ/RimL family protein N-acetyltransferase
MEKIIKEKREEFDIRTHKPYKDYKGLTKFKSIQNKKMSWPKIEPRYILGEQYIIRHLLEHEIDEIVNVYREGYPELYSNTEAEVVLYPDSLLEYLNSKDGFMQGKRLMIVIEKKEEKRLVGAVIIKIDPGNMSAFWERGVIHPEYRGNKIFRALLKYCDELTENTGAEYVSATAVTFHSASQKLLEELGWKTRGIFPGAMAIWNHDDNYCRMSVVYFDKFYNGGEELMPKDMELTPKIEAISSCLGTK